MPPVWSAPPCWPGAAAAPAWPPSSPPAGRSASWRSSSTAWFCCRRLRTTPWAGRRRVGGRHREHTATGATRPTPPSSSAQLRVTVRSTRPSTTRPSWPGSRALARFSATPTTVAEFERVTYETDVRDILPGVHVPTAVCRRRDGKRGRARRLQRGTDRRREGRRVRGRRVTPRGSEDPEPFVAAIEGFLASVRREQEDLDRLLATVLFTDVVGSTQRAAELGDARWKELLERHCTAVRALLARYRGTEVKTMGDGFLATFDGPARAVTLRPGHLRGGQAPWHRGAGRLPHRRDRAAGLRRGRHRRPHRRPRGALAGPSEVLVSSTVKDLVAGSGLGFADRGEHELKGVPGAGGCTPPSPPRCETSSADGLAVARVSPRPFVESLADPRVVTESFGVAAESPRPLPCLRPGGASRGSFRPPVLPLVTVSHLAAIGHAGNGKSLVPGSV